MSEGGSHFSDYLSIYSSFVTMLSVFLGFILATVTLVCTLPTDLLYRRLTLIALLLSFSLMDWTLIRTHANVLKEFAERGQRFPCAPYNDELLTFAMTFMSFSISGMLLIGGLTIPEAAAWLAVSIALACYAFIRITKAKRTPQPEWNQTTHGARARP